MPDDYAYPLAQCDVPAERRPALEAYRAKRHLWLSWIDEDEHHAIWQVLSSMIWSDVAFKTLASFAVDDEKNALTNTLLGQALIDGHVATQVLAIRRLMDNDNISLRRLVTEIRRNFGLFTRENFVCFDGLPYDYEAVQQKDMLARIGNGAFWGETSGPGAYSTSRMAHEQFDRLAGINPTQRTRGDRLPTRLLTTIEAWLDNSGADDLAKWSSTYLAHAGGPEARKRIADLTITANKLSDAIKALARVTEAVSAWLLFASGRSNSLMPVAQFNPFEKLDTPIMRAGGEAEADALWRRLSNERDRYLEDVDVALIGSPKPASTETPRAEYVDRLMEAAAADDQEEMERLCDKEVEATLRDLHGSER